MLSPRKVTAFAGVLGLVGVDLLLPSATLLGRLCVQLLCSLPYGVTVQTKVSKERELCKL